MKKLTKIFAVVLVIAMLGTMLVACGTKLSGEYATPTGLSSLKFDGNEVTGKLLGFIELDTGATYKIKDDKITFYNSEDEEIATANFKLDGDTITISGEKVPVAINLTKVEKK